MTQIRGKI